MEKRIVAWIKQQVKKRGCRGVVFGLSGGLDSCVVAALAKKALGGKHCLALLLPCHSQPIDARHGRLLVRRLGIRSKTIDLTPVYDAFVSILPSADRMTLANIRPRLRMTALYYMARKLNFLVCGTSNKSELKSGYFTKFGDGASDILPLGDLYKTQVRSLAVELGIPQEIIDKPPTAGLWPGQTDEGEMGITYPELDEILGCLECGRAPRLPADKVGRVKRLFKQSEHKRCMPEVFRA